MSEPRNVAITVLFLVGMVAFCEAMCGIPTWDDIRERRVLTSNFWAGVICLGCLASCSILMDGAKP